MVTGQLIQPVWLFIDSNDWLVGVKGYSKYVPANETYVNANARDVIFQMVRFRF